MSIEKIEREPHRIIGIDACLQLVFEGYEIVKADELSRLREVERRAKEVIRPFAKYANLACSAVNIPNRRVEVAVYADDDAEITVGHFRKIAKFARVLSEREGQE